MHVPSKNIRPGSGGEPVQKTPKSPPCRSQKGGYFSFVNWIARCPTDKGANRQTSFFFCPANVSLTKICLYFRKPRAMSKYSCNAGFLNLRVEKDRKGRTNHAHKLLLDVRRKADRMRFPKGPHLDKATFREKLLSVMTLPFTFPTANFMSRGHVK